MKKRIFSGLLAFMLVLSLGLTPAYAAEDKCPACGDVVWTEVKAADWAAGGAIAAGHYRLTENVDITAALTVAAGETVCIDLNGNNITAAGSTANAYRVFENSGSLTILDTTAKEENGAYISGVISGGYKYASSNLKDTFGGNIYCTDGSVFNLYSGTISGGTVHRKYHSTSNYGGGNIYSQGDVNIYGGLVTKGYAWGNLVGGGSTTAARQTHIGGGNIYVVDGVLTITGGKITDGKTLNEAYGKGAPGTYYAYAGNIWVEDTLMTVSGGEITGGTTTANNKGMDNETVKVVTSKALGGNIALTGTSNLIFENGLVSGGVVSAYAEALEGKTLTKTDLSDFGGNIFASTKSTIRITDGVFTKGTAYQGGSIYAGGKITINGGSFSDSVATAGNTSRTEFFGGCVYSNDTLTLNGGTFTGGEARRGGNIYINKNLTMTAGLLQGGVAIDRGGNLGTMNGTLNITGGTIKEGYADKYGGNVWCGEKLYLYGGSILDPAEGNNVTLISSATAYIYGGTIYAGEFGSGIYAYDGSSASPGHVYMYGGTVVNIATGTYGTNNIHIYNGFVGSFSDLVGNPLTLETLDANADGLPVVPKCAHVSMESGYIVWHHFEGDCDKCGHTYGSSPCETCSAIHKIPAGGTHTFEVNGETGVAECVYCGLSMDGKVCCAIEGEYYADLEAALLEAKAAGKTVKLIKDLEIENLNLYGSLDLSGYTLTVTGVLGAENKEATLSDSVGTGGIIGKVFMNPDNAQIAVPVAGVWKLERVAMNQILETVSEDEVLLKFIFTDSAADTFLDDATVNGDEYKIRIQVKWTENGEEKVHYFRYNNDMVKEYAATWGEKMYTCTITGLAALENCKITAQLVSGGVVVSAKDITPPSNSSVSRFESGEGYTTVGNMLSWEKINSFPIKNDKMTVQEMRQLVVDFYNFSKTFTWVSNADNSYEVGAGYGIGNYQTNGVYGGFPYVSLGTGNPYRFMDFMDERTGVVNINEANKYPTLFGNQCSQSAYYSWGRFVNSAKYSIYTAYMVQGNGYIPVGPYTYDETITEFTEEYGTGKIIEDNGLDVMYESYACLQMADGIVRKFPGGHTVMVCSDPVVVRDENGKIDPAQSYIIVSDQIASWLTATNAQGDTYTYTRNVKVKWNFDYLIEKGYIPFTFGEFLGTDPVEETVVSYSHQGNTITRAELFSSKITANYEILDIYAVFTDSEGNEVYRLANRTQNPFTLEMGFSLEAERDGIPGYYQWGSLEDLSKDETYTVQIIAQLVSGERPTLWTGTYAQ